MKKAYAGAAIALLFVINIYSLISTGSRIFKSDQLWSQVSVKKSVELKNFISALDKAESVSWISDYAPVLWWHPNEVYKATDPQEILSNSTLWYRQINRFFPFIDDELKDLGPFNAANFKTVIYKGASPADDVSRLMETGGIDQGYAGFEIRYDAFISPKLPAPLFWRISRHPLFKDVQPDNSHRALIPIEFWYHFNFNDTRWHFGNHDGDWESVLFVFDVTETEGVFKIKPFVVSISAHGGSSWHCAKDLSRYKNLDKTQNENREEGRIELFDAWGTHATYAETGNHWRLIYPDRAERGEAWETWKLMRPVEKENFYGFSGSWGRTSYVYFQNAPIPPGPHFKYLPADADIERSTADFKKIMADCAD